MNQSRKFPAGLCYAVFLPLLLALVSNFIVVINQLDLHYIDGFKTAFAKGIAIDLAVIISCWSLLLVMPPKRGAAYIFSAAMTGALFLLIADSFCFYFSLARLNSGILHDINIYALRAVLTSSDVMVLGSLSFGLVGYACVCGRAALAFHDSATPELLHRRKFSGWLIIFVAMLIQFIVPGSGGPAEVPAFNAELAPHYRNSFLKNLGDGVFRNIWNARRTGPAATREPYNNADLVELRSMGLLSERIQTARMIDKPFRRVVMLVFESLALDYFHSVNSDIPPAASDFFDDLQRRFPAARNFRNSSYPTLQGLMALLCSRLPPEHHLMKSSGVPSLFQLMKQQHGSSGFIITGNSRFYGGENVIFKNVLGVDHYVSFEDLALEGAGIPSDEWGFHDDVVLDKAFQIMKKHRSGSYLVLAKTIDMHQPPSYCGVPLDQLPQAIASHSSQIVRSVYWVNHCLRRFFADVEAEGLLDDETLVVVTADHYPMPNYGHSDLIKGEYYLYNRLPLIFVSARNEVFAGYKPDQLSCQIDLAPALCYLTGTSQPSSYMGYDLLAPVSVPRALGFYNNVFNLETASGAVNFPVNLSKKEYPAIARWINNAHAAANDAVP